MGFGRGNVMHYVGCITILLRSMIATCESNENGRFLTQLGLAKLSLEAGWRVIENVVFLGKKKNISGKKTHAFCILAWG